MKIGGGGDYEAAAAEIAAEEKKNDPLHIVNGMIISHRPDLYRVMLEIFATSPKPEMPEGWDIWRITELVRGPDDVGYLAWIGCKNLHGEPHVDWQRKAIGIFWSDDELDKMPLGALSVKISKGLRYFLEKAQEYPEDGAFPMPPVIV